jgi:hypothetical protein
MEAALDEHFGDRPAGQRLVIDHENGRWGFPAAPGISLIFNAL